MIVAAQDNFSVKNFIVSPIEIWAMLLTVAEQARERGESKPFSQLLQALHLEEGTNLQEEFLRYYEFVRIIDEDFRVKELCFEFENQECNNLLGNTSGTFEYENDGNSIDFTCQMNAATANTSDNLFKESIQWKIDEKIKLLTLSTTYSMRKFRVSKQITSHNTCVTRNYRFEYFPCFLIFYIFYLPSSPLPSSHTPLPW